MSDSSKVGGDGADLVRMAVRGFAKGLLIQADRFGDPL
jgi:hypothetical protein